MAHKAYWWGQLALELCQARHWGLSCSSALASHQGRSLGERRGGNRVHVSSLPAPTRWQRGSEGAGPLVHQGPELGLT